MRSPHEVAFARFLDRLKIKWVYESASFYTPFGWYLPDFYLPKFDYYIEVISASAKSTRKAKSKMKSFSETHHLILIHIRKRKDYASCFNDFKKLVG
jgi:hypothetical protein